MREIEQKIAEVQQYSETASWNSLENFPDHHYLIPLSNAESKKAEFRKHVKYRKAKAKSQHQWLLTEIL